MESSEKKLANEKQKKSKNETDINKLTKSIAKSREEMKENANFLSFNTQVEYIDAMEKLGIKTTIRLVDVKNLRHVEGYSTKRVEWLKDKIVKEGIWNKPICIDSESKRS